jgi:AraC-like DNA-binding protein
MDGEDFHDPGLEVARLDGDGARWLIIGADTLHRCQGSGRLDAQGATTTVADRDLVFIPRGTRYRLCAPHQRLRIRNRALAQNLPADRQAAGLLRNTAAWAARHGFILPIPDGRRPDIDQAIDTCLSAASPLARKAGFFGMLVALESFVSTVTPEPSAVASASVKALLDHIAEHYGEPLSVADGQFITGLSRSHFHVAFRQATGTTFYRYLTTVRIGEASRLLRSTADSILAIALTCGFNSPSQFYKAFKKQTGTTPERHRHGRPAT